MSFGERGQARQFAQLIPMNLHFRPRRSRAANCKSSIAESIAGLIPPLFTCSIALFNRSFVEPSASLVSVSNFVSERIHLILQPLLIRRLNLQAGPLRIIKPRGRRVARHLRQINHGFQFILPFRQACSRKDNS